MNKLLLLSILPFCFLFTQAQNKNKVLPKAIDKSTAYDWNQMEESDQNRIKEASEKYLQKFAENDITGFWELCHPEFKEKTPLAAFNEVGNIIMEMFPSMDSLTFIDGKKIDYITAPQKHQFATGGSLDKNDLTYLEYYSLPGIKNQALSFYKLSDTLFSRTIAMKFGLVDADYKLINLDISASAIRYKDAEYYIALSEKWETDELLMPQFFALNMAYVLSYAGRGTKTGKMIDINNKLEAIKGSNVFASEIEPWGINGSKFEIIDIDMIELEDDIVPNIHYSTQAELTEEAIKKEAIQLLTYLKEKYPHLIQEFNSCMFSAYEGYETASFTNQYQLLQVLVDVNDLK